MTNHWLDRSEYPFKSNYFKVDGYNLHYIDEGQGATILFVHGTPSWSFDYRNIIKELKLDYRCIAIDHMGFGLSDKPENYDYSTQNHSKTLGKFIFDKQLENLTLVVHDFGGPIGLNFAIQHSDKISNLIILNSWLWSSRTDPDFRKLSKILRSPWLLFLYRCLNFSARYVLPGTFGYHKISGRILKQYTKPFANRTQRNGTLAFARSLLNDQEWFEELWSKKQAIARKRTLFIWGMRDPVIKPKYLEKFCSGFNDSTTVRLEKSGHFPQEEQPEIVSESIFNFLAEGNR
ncbi:MAG: alpha/beta fold hydrolase [Saprospiraceae bacterium]|nr:alpha/beta fold hydrolase [Saprospiraceae bacterium]